MGGFYAALDVSDKTTSVCVLNAKGEVVAEAAVASTPAAIAAFLKPYKPTLERVGQESGGKAPWLHKELVRRKFPMICLDARHAHAMLSTQRNKTDKNDARALAKLVRNGWSAQAYIKSEEAFRWRMLMTHRRALKRKAQSLELGLRGSLKLVGAELEGKTRHRRFKAKGVHPLVATLAESMLRARDALMQEADRLDALLRKVADADPVCRRLMTIPGVGPNTALAFRAAIDDPTRFQSSRNVAAHFGLTPRRHQSGRSNILGHISKRGDITLRTALFEAAFAMLYASKSKCRLRAWGVRLRDRKGGKLATIAVARKLAVLMHRMWLTGREFDASPG